MKFKFRPNKIAVQWQIFAHFAVFTAIILVLLWVFQIVFLDSFYKAIKTNEIKSTANEIAENIDSTDLDNLLLSIEQQKQISVLITDSNGMNQYAKSNTNGILSVMNVAKFYSLTEQNGGTYYLIFNLEDALKSAYPGRNSANRGGNGLEFQEQRNNPEWNKPKPENLIYCMITSTQSGDKRLIMLNATISPVDATVQTLRVQLIFITLIMLILALFLALFLSRKISKPISKINTSAKTLATGNYDIHFDETGYKEISELGQTLNYAAKELSKVETLRRDLIANISHDLRTPLTMITGYSEVMRDLPGENTPENVQVVIDEANRLTSLVNDVLDISKLQSGTQQLTLTTFNLTQSIKTMMTRYAKLTDYHIKFLSDCDASVHADELKISQVVYNLVNNAITYTGSDKKITIRQILHDNKVRIEVMDTGEGIPQDKLADIWDRYYKVDKEHKRAQIGTGLGLSIVKTVLDMHGGTYGVQSEQGKGSTFWFELDVQP